MFLPKKWFFFNPFDRKSSLAFRFLKREVGVIFLKSQGYCDQSYISKIRLYASLCKQKRIFFLIEDLVFIAIRYNAYGVFSYLHKSEKSSKIRLALIKSPKKLKLFTTVHNLIEIKKAEKRKFNVSFISPLSKTRSHPELSPLSVINFVRMCMICRLDNFALGGVNKINFKRRANKKLRGFGAITYFLGQEDS